MRIFGSNCRLVLAIVGVHVGRLILLLREFLLLFLAVVDNFCSWACRFRALRLHLSCRGEVGTLP